MPPSGRLPPPSVLRCRRWPAVLSKDPSISSLILKLVNSAYYGNLRHISSINHATVILGFQMVKTIAMGVSVYQARTASDSKFDREMFWLHSLSVAYCSQVISNIAGLPRTLDKDTVFLSGLLHDVGKVIFDNYFTEDYIRVTELVQRKDLWIGHAETMTLNMNHCEAGFYLARKWQFPEPVTNAIRYHHNLEKCPEQYAFLCGVVHAADHCCRKLGLGSGGDNIIPKLDPDIAKLGLTDEVLEKAMTVVDQNRRQLEEFVAG